MNGIGEQSRKLDPNLPSPAMIVCVNEGRCVELSRVNIESLAHGGDGVGRLPDGRTAFVAYSCPGDEATVRITTEHPRWVRATIEELHVPSPDRVQPPCPYFGTCGGCQWKH